MNPAYDRYWQRKRALSETIPRFPVRRWWDGDGLCEIEQIYYDAIRSAVNLLDVGAGDLRIKRKLQKAGYKGEYHTQDISDEYPHTYKSLPEVKKKYDAVLCLDVLEHLTLEDGLGLLNTLIGILSETGILIIQTPNARCANNPLSWDMTHLHLYNLNDLWAYLSTAGFDVEGYRILFDKQLKSPVAHLKSFWARLVTTQFMGMDYAHNIALIARKQSGKR